MPIKLSHIENKLEELNQKLGRATEPCQRVDGKLVWNIGTYTLSGAYGGWNVHKIVNQSGGVSEPFGSGHISKRECYQRIIDNYYRAD